MAVSSAVRIELGDSFKEMEVFYRGDSFKEMEVFYRGDSFKEMEVFTVVTALGRWRFLPW